MCVHRWDSTMRSRASAFTLVEMLLVVALIALLISMLLPALRHGREAAREVGCRANLHGYGVAVCSYSYDNAGAIMKIVNRGAHYPNAIRRNSAANASYVGEWAINSLLHYAGGLTDDGNIYGIALCPSVDAALMQRFIKVRNIGSNHPFLEFQYTYWGRIDRVPDHEVLGNAKQELTRSRLRSDKVLISDVLNWDQSDRAWRYNHGPAGWSFNEYNWMPWDRGVTPNISTVNQAMGDGSVLGKTKARFEFLDLMNTPAIYPGGGVGRRGVNTDTFYY